MDLFCRLLIALLCFMKVRLEVLLCLSPFLIEFHRALQSDSLDRDFRVIAGCHFVEEEHRFGGILAELGSMFLDRVEAFKRYVTLALPKEQDRFLEDSWEEGRIGRTVERDDQSDSTLLEPFLNLAEVGN